MILIKKNLEQAKVKYMPIEMPYATLYLLGIAMFALSATIFQKFAIEMCMTLTLTFRIGQCQI